MGCAEVNGGLFDSQNDYVVSAGPTTELGETIAALFWIVLVIAGCGGWFLAGYLVGSI